MKKWILNILIVLVSIILLIAIFYFFNGSLEMYPTSEQVGKVKIVSLVIGISSLIIDVVLIKARIKK